MTYSSALYNLFRYFGKDGYICVREWRMTAIMFVTQCTVCQQRQNFAKLFCLKTKLLALKALVNWDTTFLGDDIFGKVIVFTGKYFQSWIWRLWQFFTLELNSLAHPNFEHYLFFPWATFYLWQLEIMALLKDRQTPKVEVEMKLTWFCTISSPKYISSIRPSSVRKS